jgi:TnpA family transposase
MTSGPVAPCLGLASSGPGVVRRKPRFVVPSTVLKKLAALPKTNVLSRALREIGRIERTLFMIEWYSSPELRDRCRAGLNKGEASNKLTRAPEGGG